MTAQWTSFLTFSAGLLGHITWQWFNWQHLQAYSKALLFADLKRACFCTCSQVKSDYLGDASKTDKSLCSDECNGGSTNIKPSVLPQILSDYPTELVCRQWDKRGILFQRRKLCFEGTRFHGYSQRMKSVGGLIILGHKSLKCWSKSARKECEQFL